MTRIARFFFILSLRAQPTTPLNVCFSRVTITRTCRKVVLFQTDLEASPDSTNDPEPDQAFRRGDDRLPLEAQLDPGWPPQDDHDRDESRRRDVPSDVRELGPDQEDREEAEGEPEHVLRTPRLAECRVSSPRRPRRATDECDTEDAGYGVKKGGA